MELLSASSVLLVGDTHANDDFLNAAVLPTAAELGVDAVVQVGDFGFYPAAQAFLRAAAEAKKVFGVEVWFLDGNHEQHDWLAAEVRARSGVERTREAVNLEGGLWYLPRGCRFVAAGMSAVAVGGAASIDRGFRRAGIDWFLEERLDDGDLAAVAEGGHAELMVCHDAPAGWQIPGLLADADLPRAWQLERPVCEEHRLRLREAFEAVEPSLVVHGHYHQPYTMEVQERWGAVEVFGLDCDSGAIWGALLDREAGDRRIRAVR